ncbi:hypothetical protein K491DRAFT_720895 [Lophiostoma macrostomum CBS 122681]|uniref:DUF7924 domain-containing protein n=1 Tax=Lophiostoma macrostomum CBS 122681 TaxID=1314788 RepID=A0A6A6SR44_9PLEO|nr:hypothetical protein K491DRAFT_720895 [Lophiostoma macrostomum CBS 122681]
MRAQGKRKEQAELQFAIRCLVNVIGFQLRFIRTWNRGLHNFFPSTRTRARALSLTPSGNSHLATGSSTSTATSQFKLILTPRRMSSASSPPDARGFPAPPMGSGVSIVFSATTRQDTGSEVELSEDSEVRCDDLDWEMEAKKTIDERTNLYHNNVITHTTRSWPKDLGEHIETVLEKAIVGIRSPKAKQVVQLWSSATLQNKAGGMAKLKPKLLYEEHPNTVNKEKLNLSKTWLPQPPMAELAEEYTLAQAQANTITGYVTRLEALADGKVPLFTAEEEMWMHKSAIHEGRGLHFPFFSSHWKAATGGESLQEAIAQAARDGTTIVNHLYDFYETVRGRKPTAVEAHHLSITSNCDSVLIWINWREDDPTLSPHPMHYMRVLRSAHATDEGRLLDIRKVLKNHEAFALDRRIKTIKAALPAFRRNTTNPQSVSQSRVLSSPLHAAAARQQAASPSNSSKRAGCTPRSRSAVESDSEDELSSTNYMHHHH